MLARNSTIYRLLVSCLQAHLHCLLHAAGSPVLAAACCGLTCTGYCMLKAHLHCVLHAAGLERLLKVSGLI